MWVFGYGSLTWKVDFPYVRKLDGHVCGFIRRFYQHSVDHRGVPESPGRVVTLLPGQTEDRVYGIAYEISKANEESVMVHLDYREKDGYSKQNIMFHPNLLDEKPFELTIYIATTSNQHYAGPADISAIAAQVLRSKGPSGANIDYLYNLAEAMRAIAPGYDDDHLFALESTVRSLTCHQRVE